MYKQTEIAFEIIGMITCLFIILWTAYLINSILLPFILAIIIAYICNPLVVKITQFGLSRTKATSIVMLVMIAFLSLFILILIPMLQHQLPGLINTLSHGVQWLQTKLNFPTIPLNSSAQHSIKNIPILVSQNLFKNFDMISWTFTTIFQSGRTVLEFVINIVLIPILVFYFLRDWEEITNKTFSLLPKKIHPTILKLCNECDLVLSAFFRGQLLVMLSLCIYYSITLSLLNLQAAIVIGLIIGVVSIFPYIGAIVGILIAGTIALVQFGTINSLLWIALIFFIGHAAENFYLTPTLIGDRIGIHPIMVIFAILAGGALFGILGILLAMPCAAIVMVISRICLNKKNYLLPINMLSNESNSAEK